MGWTHYCRRRLLFPSSKRCNDCRFIHESMSLDTCEWSCPDCGRTNGRNINAA
ncbi:zinc ribbon domain-containing protein [Vibrio harveyi]